MIQSLLFLHYLTTMTPRNLNNWSPRSNPILKSQYVYTVYYKTQQNFWIWSLSSKSFKVECRDQRLPQWLSCKECACNAGDAILIPLGWKDPRLKYIATHPSILAWRIPWTEEPGGLQFIKSQRVRHDWSNIAGMHTWTRLWELLGHLCDSCLTSICLGINRT